MGQSKKSKVAKIAELVSLEPETLFVVLNRFLFCCACRTDIKSLTSRDVRRHIGSILHKNNVLCTRLNVLSTKTYQNDRLVAKTVTKGFLEADIPLYKLRIESIKRMFDDLNVGAPSESVCRRMVADIATDQKSLNRTQISNQQVYVIIDETEKKKHKIFNVICGLIMRPDKRFLIASRAITGSACAEMLNSVILQVFAEYGLRHEQLCLLITDGAS
ncbi:hypothetical protein ECANGB1_1788 [Enterospora canceri]|uniref:DUF659 domain-containing protein n=1 Tax=Enterospora canceri TaxID=1081671 RepID=A0A1Y1S5H4_9MICR|nr:hypothetical protein ECANGB1_1788 [Enterospora canceri]